MQDWIQFPYLALASVSMMSNNQLYRNNTPTILAPFQLGNVKRAKCVIWEEAISNARPDFLIYLILFEHGGASVS